MLQLIIALLKLTFENKNYFEKVYSLSATVRQDKRIFPAVYKTKDEFQEINLENSAIYFRKTGDVRRRTEEGEGRGGCEDMVFITIPLRAVAHAPKAIFNTDNNFIDDKLSQNIANIISQASYNQLRSAFNAERVHCSIRSVNDDKYKVWEAEFKNIDIAARQDHVLCAVDFDIEIEISSDCLINFECDDVEVDVEDNEIVVTITDATAWHKTGNSLTETGKFGSTNNFGYDFIMNGTPIWQWTTDGHLVPAGERNIGTQDNPVNELWVNTLHYNIPVPNVVQSINGQTDNDQFLTFGTTGTDVNIVSSAGVHTLNLPNASVTARGLVTIGAQVFAGQKTFNSAPILNGFTQGSLLFIGASGVIIQDNANFFIDNTNKRVGIGTNSPSSKLHVAGGSINLDNDQAIAWGGSTDRPAIIGNKISGHLTFFTTATERARINSTGNFLIGTSTDSGARITIRGASNSAALRVEEDGGTYYILCNESAGVKRIGFFNVGPVARQVVPTGSSTDTVITALQNLGLFSQT